MQLALIELPPQPREWDEREVYYSLPVYIWPLFEYLRRLAFDASEYRHIARNRGALVRKWTRQVFAPTGVFVEPCAGAGALVEGWCQYVLHGLGQYVEPNQIVTGDVRELPTDWQGDWCAETPLAWAWRRASVLHQMGWRPVGRHNKRPFALVVTNPPFSLAKDVVEASWNHCMGITAILQRSSWYEPTEERGGFRKQFLQAHNPDQIVIGRCKFYRPDGSSAGDGDSCSYSWFVWGPDKIGLLSGYRELIDWRDAPVITGGAA